MTAAVTPETLPTAVVEALRLGRGLLAERQADEARREAARLEREAHEAARSWEGLLACAGADLGPCGLLPCASRTRPPGWTGWESYAVVPVRVPGVGLLWAHYRREMDGWVRRPFVGCPGKLWGVSFAESDEMSEWCWEDELPLALARAEQVRLGFGPDPRD